MLDESNVRREKGLQRVYRRAGLYREVDAYRAASVDSGRAHHQVGRTFGYIR